MDWVTALPPGGDRSYNACLVLVDRYSKTPMFLPCHKEDTAMDTAIMIWNKVISHTGLFQNIITYHPQTDGLEERMIQTLEDMIRRFCAYGLEFTYSDGFTHYCYTLISAFEVEYKTSIHSSTGKTPPMLERGWNPRLPNDTLKEDLLDIHPTASSFQIMLDKERHHANRCELRNKHPTFHVSLIKPYRSSYKELFPLGNKPPLEIPPLEDEEEKKIVKVLKERRTRSKMEREFLVRYRNPTQEDEWLLEKDIKNSEKLLRSFRHEIKPKE
ncbi:hypothetical protein O181_097118 [Austropuccinia psidii MF-1]|uniref:Integrase catalytic domain-containing protein n=1 Tax=Austropuccinia psidii MF-1 TaxID=1389203 RepID=A0A9Q3PCV4_9BASI|nr:hypothetical protein [Austropuccinia psidii MF-1]